MTPLVRMTIISDTLSRGVILMTLEVSFMILIILWYSQLVLLANMIVLACKRLHCKNWLILSHCVDKEKTLYSVLIANIIVDCKNCLLCTTVSDKAKVLYQSYLILLTNTLACKRMPESNTLAYFIRVTDEEKVFCFFSTLCDTKKVLCQCYT